MGRISEGKHAEEIVQSTCGAILGAPTVPGRRTSKPLSSACPVGAERPGNVVRDVASEIASHPTEIRRSPSRSHDGFWHDPLLVGTFICCCLVVGFQMALTIIDPSWGGAVTDWLRATLAWPEFLVVVGVGLWLSRGHRMSASWWLWSAALLTYAVARTLWSVYDQIYFHAGVPFPSLPDYFFMAQYPFFFVAVVLLPRAGHWGSRLVLVLDVLIAMGAATALSWYFMLGPLFAQRAPSLLTRVEHVVYPIADLFLLFGLTVTLLRPGRFRVNLSVLGLLVAAIISLIVADSWASSFLLSRSHVYRTDNPPDLFWTACYVLIPLAALVQFRKPRHVPAQSRGAPPNRRPQRADVLASLRLFFPLLLGLAASVAIEIHAATTDRFTGQQDMLLPSVISAVLFLLIIARQGLVFLENARLHRESEEVRANERALRELNRGKDEFLSVVSHEMRTPLTSLQGYIQLLARRFALWQASAGNDEKLVTNIAAARTSIGYCEQSLDRLDQLVDDLVDDSRIREGRLELRLEICDLSAIVSQRVEVRRTVATDRTIRLDIPPAEPVPIIADPARIGQVVDNYLINALKYSRDDRPVEVCLDVQVDMARVSVRDQGSGIPAGELKHVWERYHRVEGIAVQSGSSVGVGLGLHICRSIIERHHGRVGVESTLGQGSTFWFDLPLAH